MDKVLIAMSGGVDSSAAAFLMKEQGCECIGATMKLFHNEDIGVSRTKTCCSLEDVEDARLVALRLGIPYYVFNFSDDFKGQVIDRFISSYERGATPNPCIDCNRYLKFERLYKRARILGCDAIVTGHYARIEQENGRWLLKKSLDESKDQSYVLYSLTQEQLAHTRMPLGAMHKSETRRIAEEQGFYNADKPDSQDICFVPDGDYAGFIARYTGHDCPAGDFVDESGHVLGQHKGIVHYTVGQRKGLGIAADAPLYVVNALNHAGKPLTAERSFANFDYSADHVKCAKEYIIELILQYSTLVAQFAETYLKNDGSGRNTLNSNDFKIPAFYQAWCDNTQGNDQISNCLNSLMAALGGTDEKVSEPA